MPERADSPGSPVEVGSTVAAVAGAMARRLAELPPERRHRAPFLDTYRRTTLAVGRAVEQGRFEDPDWVERWDAAFAELYFVAHDAELTGDAAAVSRPWRLAFEASAGLPPLRLVLLGMNAHVNYDLPQSLLAVIGDEQFDDATLLARRRRDHERIDGVLAERVGAEDRELAAAGAARSPLDRVLTPLNRAATRRFLAEARRKVWHNTLELHRARRAGRGDARLAELELLAASKVADLLGPGQLLLRLAAGGFGVVLPP